MALHRKICCIGVLVGVVVCACGPKPPPIMRECKVGVHVVDPDGEGVKSLVEVLDIGGDSSSYYGTTDELGRTDLSVECLGRAMLDLKVIVSPKRGGVYFSDSKRCTCSCLTGQETVRLILVRQSVPKDTVEIKEDGTGITTHNKPGG
jgi:hypothetical protein